MLGRGAVCGVLIAVCLATPAAADIYWANEGGNTIGRAEADGTNPDPSFISGANVAPSPHAVAVDAGYVYWAHDGIALDAPAGNIGRAPLGDPAAAQPTFVPTTDSPRGLTLDQAGIYWTQATPGTGAIGRANVFNGAVTNQSHVSNIAAAGGSPCGLTTDADKFFWALDGAPGKVIRSHGTFPPFTEFLPGGFPAGTTGNPCGVAEANGIVYWANRSNDTIGRVDLTGTAVQAPIDAATGAAPCGVAVDGAHIYWTEQGRDRISRAGLDGSNVNAGPEFPIALDAADDPCGIAVDPTAAAEPALQTFTETAVGGRSETATLVLRNTSSSVLDTTAISFAGADPGEFELAADGCTINVVPAGQICVLNVNFAPTQAGIREAVLRVVTNAGNSPTDFALRGEATSLPGPPAPPPIEPPPPAVEPAAIAATLSISYSRKADRFKGRLRSQGAGCVPGRKVVVYRRKRGVDPRVASDLTNRAGRWRARDDDAGGRFYAVAKPAALADGDTCLAADSRTLKLK